MFSPCALKSRRKEQKKQEIIFFYSLNDKKEVRLNENLGLSQRWSQLLATGSTYFIRTRTPDYLSCHRCGIIHSSVDSVGQPSFGITEQQSSTATWCGRHLQWSTMIQCSRLINAHETVVYVCVGVYFSTRQFIDFSFTKTRYCVEIPKKGIKNQIHLDFSIRFSTIRSMPSNLHLYQHLNVSFTLHFTSSELWNITKQ